MEKAYFTVRYERKQRAETRITNPMNIHEALGALGVREDILSQAQKDQLDREGYLPLTGILSPEQIVQMRDGLDQRLIEEGAQGGQELGYARGHRRLLCLQLYLAAG